MNWTCKHYLYPICAEPEKSFMSDHIAMHIMQTVTAEEFWEMKHLVDQKLDDLVSALNSGMLMRVTPCSEVPLEPVQFSGVNLGPIQNAQGRNICRITTPYLSAPPKPIEDDSHDDSDSAPRSRLQLIPIASMHIPDIGHECGGWCKAVKQWEQGTLDMPQGLALKDWPKERYTKGMASVMGIKHSQQKLVIDEYVRCAQNLIADRQSTYVTDFKF
jgi:hypothetical protein